MACKIVTSKVTRFQVLAYLLDGIRAIGLSFFVDVDLHPEILEDGAYESQRMRFLTFFGVSFDKLSHLVL